MSAAVFFNFRPGSGRTLAATGPRLHAGDVVAWTNPATGVVWCELEVEQVFPIQGTVTVRGCFGRMTRSGQLLLESRKVRIDQVVLEQAAGERGVL